MVSIRAIILVTLLVYSVTMLYIISHSTPPKRKSNLYEKYEVIKQLSKEQLEAKHKAQQEEEARNEHSKVPDFESPIVVTGTAGTGTRVANDILEHAGKVFMGLKRNEQRDSSIFDFYVKRYVEDIVIHTEGKLDYNIESLPVDLATKIRKGIDEFAVIMEADAREHSKSGRWGWKESQAMFFLPFLYEKYPAMRLVHVLRDGRDVAFSKQQRARFQEGYVRIITRTQADLKSADYAKAVIKTWQLINMNVASWMEKNKPTRYNMIRLEDMCGGHAKDYAGKLLTDVLGDRIVADNPAATVNTAECRIGKYKSQDPTVVQELEKLASEGLQFFDYHIRDNGEEPDQSELYPENPHVHHNPGADESDSPIVVTGTAGTGTRVANDIFEHAGKVFMGGRRNVQRDSTEFDDYVKKYVEEILQVTKGKLNYEISDIPSHLAEKIRKGIETFDSVMTKERHNAVNGRWGWKESQAMFFYPFLFEKYPKLRVVHVVRDGRDIAFSNQQRKHFQEGYNRIVTVTKAPLDSDEYAKAVITTWQIINLSATKWLSDNRSPYDFTIVRLEDMCGDQKATIAQGMLTHLLGIDNIENAAKTVSADQCRLLKYKEKDPKLVEELVAIAHDALAKFEYIFGQSKTPSLSTPWKGLTFPELVELQSSKSTTGTKEVILLATDSSYKSVFLNWLILANHHNVHNYLMIALNQEMHDFCKALGFPSFYFEKEFPAHTDVSKIWMTRVKIIIRILEMGVGVHMVDSDAFFLQNPYPFMHNDHADIEALPGDFPWGVSWSSGKIGTINGGFVRIKANHVSIHFMQAVLKHMQKSHTADDQHSLNHLLDDLGIKWTAEPGCQYNYGLCHYGNTTINDIFKDLRPDARIHIRLLDKPHFPVLASWMRHDCYKRFYLQWSPTRPVEEQESHYYYTPIVVHPAGSPKTGHSKIDFFRTNGLWFLKDEDKHTLTSRSAEDESLDVTYLESITNKALQARVDEMHAFFERKRKGKIKSDDKCYV